MLARDWYYNERNRMGIEPAVASIYDAHDDADLRARAALKMLGVQRGWRIADIGEATVALFILAMPFTAPLAALRLFVAPAHNRKRRQRSPASPFLKRTAASRN